MENIDLEISIMKSQLDKLTLDNILKDECNELSLMVNKEFEKQSNPYNFFLRCLTKINLKDLDRVDDTFPTKLRNSFQNFLEADGNKKTYSPLITPFILMESLKIIKKLQNKEVQKSLIEIFSMKDRKPLLMLTLMKDLRHENVSNTVKLINILEIGSYFEAEDILIPLLIESKLEDIDEFLECNEMHRKTFIQALDKIVGNENLIPILKNKVLYEAGGRSRSIFQVGLALLKKYGLASELCPHIIYRQRNGRLRFLFINFYEENDMTLQSFLLFVKDISENDDTLKKEALKLFVRNNDIQSALWYLKEVNVDLVDIPYILRNYKQQPKTQILNFEEFTRDRNQSNYYQLNLPSSATVIVDTYKEFSEAIIYLSSCNVIAIDSECKPVRLYDDVMTLSLIQIASLEKVFIFDMIKLPGILLDYHWSQFGELFSDEHILKLSFSFTDDVEIFEKTNMTLGEHIKKIANTTDLMMVGNELAELRSNVFTYHTDDFKGLSLMVYKCFGKPLDQLEQCSYWSLRPLSSGQLIYAALDAYCLIEIYNYLNEKCIQLKIDREYLKSSNLTNSIN